MQSPIADEPTVAADDVRVTARRRRDGWWDQRTTSGKSAAALFNEECIRHGDAWIAAGIAEALRDEAR